MRKFYNKMLSRFPENDMFLKIILSIYLEKFTIISILRNTLFLSYYLIVMVTNEGLITCKCFK